MAAPETTAQLDRVRSLLEPTLRFLGFELYDLELVRSGGAPTLRVTIDRAAGVTLDDCERVSQSLSALLDQADPFAGRYDLEVSSPGAERPLRSLEEYRRFLGKRANIRYRVGEGERVAEGAMVAVSPESLELQLRDHQRIAIPMADILAARLAIAF